MSIIHSFEPIVGSHAKILILGSMPGEASLSANQYYAHRRNAFWPIIAQLLQINPAAAYQDKIAALKSSPLALWAALKSCTRHGRPDSMIEADTQAINDFQSFFSVHQQIKHVFFNGGKAEACFKRYVLSVDELKFLSVSRLPSTSPANARLSLEDKLRIWHEMINSVLGSEDGHTSHLYDS